MIEFIHDQGEIQGLAEYEFRLKAYAYAEFRAFGKMASVVRTSARLAWVQPANPSSESRNRLHVLATRR